MCRQNEDGVKWNPYKRWISHHCIQVLIRFYRGYTVEEYINRINLNEVFEGLQ